MAAPFIQTSKNTKVYKYREMHFWAERGLCHVVDQRDGDYKARSIKDFLIQAKAFNDANTRPRQPDLRERSRLSRMVRDMLTCAREARHQGDPLDPRVRSQMQRRLTQVSLTNIRDVHARLPRIPNLHESTDLGEPRRPGRKLVLPGDYGF